MVNKKEPFSFVDEIEWVHRDKNGKVIKRYSSNTRTNRILKMLHLKSKNCMTNDAFAQVAAWMLHDIDANHSSYANCDWLGIGTGTGAADPTDYKLGTSKSRLAGVGTRVTTSGITNNTAQIVVTFSQANDAGLTGIMAITEVGMFWASTGDHTMLMRQTFTAENMNWDQGDTFEMTVKVQNKQGS